MKTILSLLLILLCVNINAQVKPEKPSNFYSGISVTTDGVYLQDEIINGEAYMGLLYVLKRVDETKSTVREQIGEDYFIEGTYSPKDNYCKIYINRNYLSVMYLNPNESFHDVLHGYVVDYRKKVIQYNKDLKEYRNNL